MNNSYGGSIFDRVLYYLEVYKLLVVEDEVLIRDIIKEYFATRDYEVIEAVDGYDALEKVNQDIDMVLLDIMMPGMDGYETCKKIREKYDMPIIFISALSETDNMLDGYHVGADDYITKPFSVRELVARVKANLRKVEAVSNNVVVEQIAEDKKKENRIIVGELELDLDKFETKVRGEIIDLTLREFEVLKFLASQPEQVVTRETLLERVWGYEYYGDIRTVDVTVRRIREKIEKDTSAPKILITKRGVGYYIAKR